MPRRGSYRRPTSPTGIDDVAERILAAAERCIDRHGFRTTRMVDTASEVGLSRPNVYDYFADRDDLFDPAHTTISRQSSLSDQIVERCVASPTMGDATP
jgi:DNA-binding transcriptional regulator YbjK